MSKLVKRTTSPEGLAFIKQEEGEYGKVYADRDGEKSKRKGLVSYDEASPHTDRGWPTIGIGHLIYYVGTWTKDERDRFSGYLRDGNTMSKAEMHQLLLDDLAYFEKSMNKKLKVPVSQQQFDALISMAFNSGMGDKALLKAIEATNNKKPEEAAQAILGGKSWLAGLANRRKKEAALYLSGVTKPIYTKPLFWVGISGVLLIGAFIYRQSS